MSPKSRNQDETARLRQQKDVHFTVCKSKCMYKFHCSNEMRSKFYFCILSAVLFTKITRLSVICHRLSIRQMLHRHPPHARVQTPNEREVQTSKMRARASSSGERTLMGSSPPLSRLCHSDGLLRAAPPPHRQAQALPRGHDGALRSPPASLSVPDDALICLLRRPPPKPYSVHNNSTSDGVLRFTQCPAAGSPRGRSPLCFR
jgi:hypothetical protein